ncbi:MAG: glycosyltransferase [Acidobacteria bacterium]|nr:glycosyltransferase [Acidobacteriota bacterium]MBV9184509.1 glycosyltransferase [Acidobacteriota bacterium]
MIDSNRPVRVVHVITALTLGGAETALFRLLSNTDRERFESTVIALAGDGVMAPRIAALGVEVLDLGLRRGGFPNPLSIFSLARHLRRLQPDVVQSWMYHADVLATLAVPLARAAKLVWNIRCSEAAIDTSSQHPLKVVSLLALLSGRPDAVVVNSQSGLDYHAACGYTPRRWSLIPNGFDLDEFRVDAQAAASVRNELGLHSAAPLVGLIARWDPLKDHRTFVEAARLLVDKRPDVHFLLAGNGTANSNQTLATWIEERQLGTNMHLLGERDDIARITASLDIASLTSVAEGFPNVVAEAMACGVPCVVTDAGDARWIIGDSGRVVPPRQPAMLAGAWQELLEMGPSEKLELGRRARQRISTFFSIGRATDAYEELYATLAQSE